MEYSSNWDNPIRVGPWGYHKNKKWSFKPNTGIREITIRYGGSDGVIDSISFTTTDDNGKISTSDRFGGPGGSPSKIQIGWPREYLVKIKGLLSSYNGIPCIGSLEISTNLAKYGPFASTSGSRGFEFSMKDGVIIGFHGHHGVYLNSIGVYFKTTADLFIPQTRYLISEPIKEEAVEPTTLFQKFDVPRAFGPWGGETGRPWNDGSYPFVKRIDVHVRSGVVNGIQIQYQNNKGLTVDSKLHGCGEEAETVYRVKLKSCEYVTGIMGFYGAVDGSSTEIVRSLSFYTNKGRYGPFGREIGMFFSSSQGKIVGIYGRSGYFLDAVGVFIE